MVLLQHDRLQKLQGLAIKATGLHIAAMVRVDRQVTKGHALRMVLTVKIVLPDIKAIGRHIRVTARTDLLVIKVTGPLTERIRKIGQHL